MLPAYSNTYSYNMGSKHANEAVLTAHIALASLRISRYEAAARSSSSAHFGDSIQGPWSDTGTSLGQSDGSDFSVRARCAYYSLLADPKGDFWRTSTVVAVSPRGGTTDSLRHVPTHWAQRVARRTRPTAEDLHIDVDPSLEPDRYEAEQLMRERRFHRYGDYLHARDS